MNNESLGTGTNESKDILPLNYPTDFSIRKMTVDRDINITVNVEKTTNRGIPRNIFIYIEKGEVTLVGYEKFKKKTNLRNSSTENEPIYNSVFTEGRTITGILVGINQFKIKKETTLYYLTMNRNKIMTSIRLLRLKPNRTYDLERLPKKDFYLFSNEFTIDGVERSHNRIYKRSESNFTGSLRGNGHLIAFVVGDKKA